MDTVFLNVISKMSKFSIKKENFVLENTKKDMELKKNVYFGKDNM